MRKPIIGVMGGDHKVGASAEDARLVGALIVRRAGILLTGGRCINDLSVKNAAMMGADDESHDSNAPARPAIVGGRLYASPFLENRAQPYRTGCNYRHHS
jgi:hypothetical protein